MLSDRERLSGMDAQVTYQIDVSKVVSNSSGNLARIRPTVHIFHGDFLNIQLPLHVFPYKGCRAEPGVV